MIALYFQVFIDLERVTAAKKLVRKSIRLVKFSSPLACYKL